MIGTVDPGDGQPPLTRDDLPTPPRRIRYCICVARAGSLSGEAEPYRIFGTFGGLPFWQGGLTVVAAAPGAGKTSWLLQMTHAAAAANFPAAIACYEHTAQELKFRLGKQAEAIAWLHRGGQDRMAVEAELGRGGEAVLLALSGEEDTLRAVEESLIERYSFPRQGPALVCIDYLQRIPQTGDGLLAGTGGGGRQAMLPGSGGNGGGAAAGLRALARRGGWAIAAASALRRSSYRRAARLEDLLGDERLAYEPDRILYMHRAGAGGLDGSDRIEVQTIKDRTGPLNTRQAVFMGSSFYLHFLDEAR